MRPEIGLVSLCALALLATVHLAPVAAADPPSEGTVMTDKARQLYEEGVTALKKNQLAEARASFLAAFSLNKHWQIAGNLADSEIQLGRFRDGAEHAAYYLRNAPPDRRERAEGLLKLAKAKIGTLKLVVDQAGAELLVDDVSIGRAPLAEVVFVDPGKRKVTARFAGRDDVVQSVEVTAGSEKQVSLKIIPVAPPASASSTAIVPPPPPGRSLVPGLVLAGAGVAALAAGIGLMIDANGKYSSSGELSDAIRTAGHSCVTGAANFDARCEDLFSTGSAANTHNRAGIGILVGGGVLGAAAVTYFLWPTSPKAMDARAPQRLVPAVSTSGAGLIWSGAF